MKFNGIVASLAIASTASAAAIPRDVAVQQALDQVTTVAGNVDNLVNGLVGGLLGCNDVTKVQQELSNVKTQLTKALPVKRDITSDVTDTAGNVVDQATDVVKNIRRDSGALATVNDLASSLLSGAQDGSLNLNQLTGLLNGINAGGLTQILGGLTQGGLTHVLDNVLGGILGGGLLGRDSGALATVDDLASSILGGLKDNSLSLNQLTNLLNGLNAGGLTQILGGLTQGGLTHVLNNVLGGILGGGLLGRDSGALATVDDLASSILGGLKDNSLSLNQLTNLLNGLNAGGLTQILGGLTQGGLTHVLNNVLGGILGGGLLGRDSGALATVNDLASSLLSSAQDGSLNLNQLTGLLNGINAGGLTQILGGLTQGGLTNVLNNVLGGLLQGLSL